MENKTELQSLLDRVCQMEQYMDEVAGILKNSPDELKNNEEVRKKVETLTDYMDSGQWLADYKVDERGELPRDLKRGVLSEDGLYNLISEVEEVCGETENCEAVEKEFFRETEKCEAEGGTSDFSINEMLEMQRSLQDRYKTIWEPITAETGKNKLLWMIGEIGEVIDIVKKNGDIKACSDTELRKDLVEELADVLMYYNDVLLCYDISVEELKKAYTEKFERNMKRWKVQE